jgi:regulator of protease activity HflC (stomatin/prohibitin superfamily)
MFELVVGGVILGGIMSLLTGVRVLREYERAVVFRMGRARKDLLGPGMNLVIPFGIDRPRVIDVRTKAIQIAPQEVITRDNISISVDAVVYATIASPRHAVLEVEDYWPATLQLAATTLRAVLGKMEMDDILVHRDAINAEVRTILDTRTEQWGVEISAVEIKDIQLPKEMQRAMARQAEAERERRAKVIAAEGEVQAAEKLTQAAAIMAQHPGALQLRLYQTLVEVAGEASSTIVFPVPIDLGGAGMGPSANPAALQAAMQSAVALAASQQKLGPAGRGQLGEASRGAGAGNPAIAPTDAAIAPFEPALGPDDRATRPRK